MNCKNCVHFGTLGSKTICERVTYEPAENKITFSVQATADDDSGLGCWVEVSEDFGCVLFEAVERKRAK